LGYPTVGGSPNIEGYGILGAIVVASSENFSCVRGLEGAI
jgi:hypothetical protein